MPSCTNRQTANSSAFYYPIVDVVDTSSRLCRTSLILSPCQFVPLATASKSRVKKAFNSMNAPSKKRANDREVDPARRRWDLNQLSHQEAYTSSKQLWDDISKIRKTEKRKGGGISGASAGGNGKRVRKVGTCSGKSGTKRASSTRQQLETIEITSNSLTPFYSQHSASPSYATYPHTPSQSPTYLYQTFEPDRLAQKVTAMLCSELSLDSRLGRHQLALSLGNHLLFLGINNTAPVIRGLTDYRLPTTYTSYQDLKASDIDKELSDIIDIWIAFALTVGVLWSCHSGILGSYTLPSVPSQTLLDLPLDLRAQGAARYAVRMHLIRTCLSKATAPDSPLIMKADKAALTIILAILNAAAHIQPWDAREVLKTAMMCFRKMWFGCGEEERKELVDQFLSAIYAYDISINMLCNEVPLLTVADLRMFLKGAGMDLKFFTDPLILFECDDMEALMSHYSWANFSQRRRIIIVRNNIIKKDKISLQETEVLCRELVDLCRSYRTWREGNLEAIPISGIEEIIDVEQSVFKFTEAMGGKHEDIGHSILCQNRETKNAFLTLEVIESCLTKFGEESPVLVGMKKEMEKFCDGQVGLLLDLFEHLLLRLEKFRRPILEERFHVRIRLISYPIKFGYLYRWTLRNSHKMESVYRLLGVMKHLAYLQKELGDMVDDFERVQRSFEALVIDDNTLMIGTQEEYQDMDQDSILSTSPSRLSQYPSPISLQFKRSPSPSLADFPQTLSTLITPAR